MKSGISLRISHPGITLLLFLILAAVPSAPASPYDESSPENRTGAFNPNNDSRRAGDSATDRAVARLSQPVLVNAGTAITDCAPCDACSGSSCPAFKDPSVFATNLYTNNRDERSNGFETFQYRLQVGFDFVTYADIVTGLMYTYGYEEGEINGFPAGAGVDLEKTTHHVTVYAGRSFGDWIIAGATMSVGWGDQKNETEGVGLTNEVETFSYAPSVYVGAAHAWDRWGFSSVVSYQYENIEYGSELPNNIASFDDSTGTFTWKTQGTWFAADWVDVSAYFKLVQIVHTNIDVTLPTGESNDHNWGTVGAKAVFYPAKNWDVTAGVDYDVLNLNYTETITAMLGAGYKF